MLSLEESIAEEKKKYRDSDRLLNAEYKKLSGPMDRTAREKLMKAQRAWLAFRDANAVLHGDSTRGKTASGTIGKNGELILYTTLREMTEARALELATIRQEREAAAKA